MDSSHTFQTIYVGADHGGFALKEEVKQWLMVRNYHVEDVGAAQLEADDDYPRYALAVAQAVAAAEKNPSTTRGILLCRSGGGMVIAANKVDGVRAVAVQTPQAAQHAREHNNANIISLAADWIDPELVPEIIETFLMTKFDPQSRHARRLEQISAYEHHRS